MPDNKAVSPVYFVKFLLIPEINSFKHLLKSLNSSKLALR